MTKTEAVRNRFLSEFNTEPIMVFSPGRINLIGEHTDYNEGFVLPASIDLGFTIAINKSNANTSKIIALDKSESAIIHFNDIKPLENGGWKNYVLGLVAEFQKKTKALQNFNMVFGSDLPEGAGMSSSAAMLNGMGMAINLIQNLTFSNLDLIKMSQATEHNFVGLECGIMDQYASMFGKEGHLVFLDCQNLESQLIPFELDDYELVLINSNVKHNLAGTAYNERKQTCMTVANALNQSSLRGINIEDIELVKTQIDDTQYQIGVYVLQENIRVSRLIDAIKEKNYSKMGELMYKSHEGLKTQYKVSCKELDFLVDQAKKYQFVGSRMMGGGFGGCTINLVHRDTFQASQKSIQNAFYEKFNHECSIYKVTLSNGTHKIS